MSDAPPPDYNALAKKYLDLWQEQLGKLARDPDQLSGAAATWSKLAASMLQGTGAAHEPAASAHGAAAAAAPSRDGGVDLADVLKRLDVIEQRLAALEPGPRKTSGGAGRRSVRDKKP
jgi:hypothetical protein